MAKRAPRHRPCDNRAPLEWFAAQDPAKQKVMFDEFFSQLDHGKLLRGAVRTAYPKMPTQARAVFKLIFPDIDQLDGAS